MVDVVPSWYRPLCGFGVTGTNGKTSTSLFLNAILAHVGPSAAVTTVGLFRGTEPLLYELSAAGMERTLRELAASGGRNCVLELSSEVLARGFLRKYPVKYGTFTNLTHDHLDAHQSPEHYLASKAQLFMSLPDGGGAILNAADPVAALLQEVVPSGVIVTRYGLASRGAVADATDWVGKETLVSVDGTVVLLEPNRWFTRGHQLRTRGVGGVFGENALAALATAVAAGVEPALASHALARATPPPGRFEVLSRRPLVVLDYAHTPDALARTVSTARGLCRGRVSVVFGAGGERDQAKRPLMGEAADDAETVFLTSDNPRSEDPRSIVDAIAAGLTRHPDVRVELDRREAIEAALRLAQPDDCVVVAGRGHETVQELSGERRRFSDRDVILAALS